MTGLSRRSRYRVGRIDCRVRLVSNVPVISGAEGGRASVHTDRELFRAIGSDKKRRVIVEGAGHFVHEDNPEQVFQEIVKFVF